MTSEAFAQRIVAMQDTLYRVSYGLLSRACDREDAVQECIRRSWEKREQLHTDAYMQTWVIRILIRECYAVSRRVKREIPTEALPQRDVSPAADPALHEAVLALPEKCRIPVVLHYMEGYELKEIAAMLRVPVGTVKTRLLKARKLLKAALGEEV
jgi:RNA polymerase sigma-70 factor (ECF subfamily)